MALFSIFGKKPGAPDKSGADSDTRIQDAAQEAVAAPAEEISLRDSPAQKSQRDIARMTTEKIDAIESEIARDILRAPRSSAPAAPVEEGDSPPGDEALSPEYAATNLFHTTLIRVDKETMILFKEDMDE